MGLRISFARAQPGKTQESSSLDISFALALLGACRLNAVHTDSGSLHCVIWPLLRGPCYKQTRSTRARAHVTTQTTSNVGVRDIHTANLAYLSNAFQSYLSTLQVYGCGFIFAGVSVMCVCVCVCVDGWVYLWLVLSICPCVFAFVLCMQISIRFCFGACSSAKNGHFYGTLCTCF